MSSRAIVVVVDGAPTPAWQGRALATLEASPALDVVGVRLAGIRGRGALGRLQDAAERRIFGIGHDALAPVEVDRRADAAGRATLVVWLSELPVDGGERRDVLAVRHAGRAEPADVAVARAILAGSACVETDVVLRRADGHETLVARTVSGVRPFSELLTRNLMLWKLAAVMPRAAERVPGLDRPSDPAAPAGSAPSTMRLLARAVPTWGRVLATRLLFRRPWSVRLRPRTAVPVRGWDRTNADDLVRWGDSPVYADPFLFEHEGRHHLFVEEVPLGAKRGVISHTELRIDGGVADPPTPVLVAPHHLSYPFVFRHGDEIFMVPETSAARRVELHRAVEFPRVWELDAILLEAIDASDATIVAHGGLLWLFAAVSPEHGSSLEELHLYWAETPQGPWRPHARNPIVSDVRAGRPAGPVQRWDGRLVRPAQDGSRRYGWAISFREIDELSPTEYAEREVARIEPGDLSGGARATHHYSCDSRFEAIDVRRREPRWRRATTHQALDSSRRDDER